MRLQVITDYMHLVLKTKEKQKQRKTKGGSYGAHLHDICMHLQSFPLDSA